MHGTLLITAMAISFIGIGCSGAIQTRSSDVMHPRIVTPTSGSCTILLFPAGTEWQFSADILVNCLCISPTALVCQPPFHRNWPLFHLQWVQKLRVINQLWPMRLIALMLLIVAGDVELNPGPTGSSPYSPTATPNTSCITMSADPAQSYILPSIRGSGQFFHACPSCKKQVHIRLKICKHCAFALRRLAQLPPQGTICPK